MSIRVTVMYPNTEGARFDMDYYVNKHVPMVGELCGDALTSVTIDEGVGGAPPGAPAPFVAMIHMTFDSVQSFEASFGPHLGQIMGDVANYTDLAPQLQISQAKE